MPVPSPSDASLVSSTPTTSAVIAIPGTTSTVSRRYAKNPLANLSAFVVANSALSNSPNAAITVSMKKPPRLLGLSLKGHSAPIVDLEFLSTTLSDPLHVLGSCDTDGIVYLWFIYVERDALGIDVRLRLLRKYSFFSLRKSRTAFYSRIRLSGSSESGTMVLVPNDGSNVRVITFHCEPSLDPGSKPNVPVIAPPPKVHALPAPPPPQEEDDVPPAPEPPAAVVSREISSEQPVEFPQAPSPVEENVLEEREESLQADRGAQTASPVQVETRGPEPEPAQNFEVPPAPEPPGEATEEVQMELVEEQPKSAPFPAGPFEEVVDVPIAPEPLVGMEVDEDVEDIDMGTDGEGAFVDAKANFEPDEEEPGFGAGTHVGSGGVGFTMTDEYGQRGNTEFADNLAGDEVEEPKAVLAEASTGGNVVVGQTGGIPGEGYAYGIGGAAAALGVAGAGALGGRDANEEDHQMETVPHGEGEDDTDIGLLVGATLVGRESRGDADVQEGILTDEAQYQTVSESRHLVPKESENIGGTPGGEEHLAVPEADGQQSEDVGIAAGEVSVLEKHEPTPVTEDASRVEDKDDNLDVVDEEVGVVDAVTAEDGTVTRGEPEVRENVGSTKRQVVPGDGAGMVEGAEKDRDAVGATVVEDQDDPILSGGDAVFAQKIVADDSWIKDHDSTGGAEKEDMVVEGVGGVRDIVERLDAVAATDGNAQNDDSRYKEIAEIGGPGVGDEGVEGHESVKVAGYGTGRDHEADSVQNISGEQLGVEDIIVEPHRPVAVPSPEVPMEDVHGGSATEGVDAGRGDWTADKPNEPVAAFEPAEPIAAVEPSEAVAAVEIADSSIGELDPMTAPATRDVDAVTADAPRTVTEELEVGAADARNIGYELTAAPEAEIKGAEVMEGVVHTSAEGPGGAVVTEQFPGIVPAAAVHGEGSTESGGVGFEGGVASDDNVVTDHEAIGTKAMEEEDVTTGQQSVDAGIVAGEVTVIEEHEPTLMTADGGRVEDRDDYAYTVDEEVVVDGQLTAEYDTEKKIEAGVLGNASSTEGHIAPGDGVGIVEGAEIDRDALMSSAVRGPKESGVDDGALVSEGVMVDDNWIRDHDSMIIEGSDIKEEHRVDDNYVIGEGVEAEGSNLEHDDPVSATDVGVQGGDADYEEMTEFGRTDVGDGGAGEHESVAIAEHVSRVDANVDDERDLFGERVEVEDEIGDAAVFTRP